MVKMTMCNVKGVACSDESIENYNQTLKFPSALQSIIVTFHFYRSYSCFRQKITKNPQLPEHLAAKEPDISLRSWWRPKQS